MFVNDSSRRSVNRTGVVCLTCLSEARKMYPIQNKDLFSSVTLFKVPQDCTYKLCWECHTMLIKIKKFRMKALRAQELLKSNKIQSLSSLKVGVPIHLSILCKPCQETSPPEVEMLPTFKQENNVNSTLSSMLQGTNCNEQDPLAEVTVKVELGEMINEGTQHMDVVKYESEDNEGTQHMDVVKYESEDNMSLHDDPTLPAKNINSCIDMKSKVNGTSHEPVISQVPNINSSCEEVLKKNIILKPTLNVSSTSNVAIDTSYSSPVRNSKAKIQMPLRCVTSVLTQMSKHTDSHKTIEEIGPKLFKNSPQLATPETLRSVVAQDKLNDTKGSRVAKPIVMKKRRVRKPQIDYMDFMTEDVPDDKVYFVKMLTDEELQQRRQESLRIAKTKHYFHFCDKCMMKFCRESLKVHLKEHDVTAGPFLCSICEQRFMTQESLDKHKEEHYKLYVCVTCKMEFNNSVLMMRHYYKNHQEILKFCAVCKAKFTNKKAFDLHKRKHNIECEVCHEKVLQCKMSVHMEKHVERSKVSCDECGKLYYSPDWLEKHKITAHSQAKEKETFYCVECDMVFKTKLCYNVHLKNTIKHNGRKFTCDKCNKLYSTRMGLKKHILVYHDFVDRSECDICKKIFNSKRAVRYHIVTQHLKSVKEKNVICDICGKAYENKACLQQHLNSHLNLRPYKCEECGATFSYSGARYTHIKLKHKKNKEKKVIDKVQ